LFGAREKKEPELTGIEWTPYREMRFCSEELTDGLPDGLWAVYFQVGDWFPGELLRYDCYRGKQVIPVLTVFKANTRALHISCQVHYLTKFHQELGQVCPLSATAPKLWPVAV
jgi:hypothetical protein